MLEKSKKGEQKICHLTYYVPQSVAQVLQTIQDLIEIYNPSAIIGDASGYAEMEFIEKSARNGGVIAHKFTQRSKLELLGRMKMAMSKGLKLPQDKLLVRELNSFYSVISDSGNILLRHARRGSDDLLDAIALSLVESESEIRKELPPEFWKIHAIGRPEESTMPSRSEKMTDFWGRNV